MSSVSSLCRLLIFRFTSSLARVLELMVLYRLSRCRWLFRMVFSRLAVLCVGAFLLFITGLMGVFGLCSFSRALRVSGVGFFLG